MPMAMCNAEKWLSHTKYEHFVLKMAVARLLWTFLKNLSMAGLLRNLNIFRIIEMRLLFAF